MESCIVRTLHSAEYFAFWILLCTIQGPTVFCWNFLSNTNFEIERSSRSILYPWWCIRHNRWNLFKAQKHLGADSKVSLLKIRCCWYSSMLYDNILPSSNYARWRLKISQLTDLKSTKTGPNICLWTKQDLKKSAS